MGNQSRRRGTTNAPAPKPSNEAVAEAARRRGAPMGLTMSYLRAFAFFILAAAVILFFVVRGTGGDDFPGTNSAEAGFARDMKTHHGQAVEMAFLLLPRVEASDPDLATFLRDMILTQQNQIGQMEGWLHVWDLPLGNDQSPMAWMGHPVDGLMPGMATQEQVAALSTLPEQEAVISFLQLMIAHHQSAVEMANEILDRTDVDVVRVLAQSIINTQQAEISLMQQFLATYQGQPGTPAAGAGATPVAAASPEASPDHSH
jgi:uncharacterized protein (DUF305 family)